MESRLVLNTRQLTPICPRVARVGVARADAANRNRMYYSFYVSLLKKNLQIAKQKTKTKQKQTLLHSFSLCLRPAPRTSYRIHHIASPTPNPPAHGVPPGPTPRPHSALDVYVMSLSVDRQEFFQTTTLFIRIWMCDFSTIMYIVISLISSVQKM